MIHLCIMSVAVRLSRRRWIGILVAALALVAFHLSGGAMPDRGSPSCVRGRSPPVLPCPATARPRQETRLLRWTGYIESGVLEFFRLLH
jgi:hypothetical protein